MKAAEKRAATEQQARNRAVKGWVFRGVSPEEAFAIEVFLAGGECPEKYRRAYEAARKELKLP